MGTNATLFNENAQTSNWLPASEFPIPLRSLWALVVSFPALWDWARLFLIGGLLESTRRYVWSLYNYLAARFVFTVTFDQNDATYRWMVVWLSNQPAWKRTRTMEISSRRPGQQGIMDCLPAEDPEKTQKSKYVQYLPAPNESLYVRLRYTWIKAQRMQEVEKNYYGGNSTTDKLTLTIYAFDRTVIDDLLFEAKRQYKAEIEGRVNVYVPSYQDWELAGSRQRRSLSSVVLDKKVKERLLADARDFMGSEKWYAERGIPWRRGYLLYGAPGCGKTSLIHALAGELELDIYIVSLSKSGLDDSDLHRLISRLPSKSLALIEDIDAAFLRSINRDSSKSASDAQAPDSDKEAHGSDQKDNASNVSGGLTLSGLLNAIDGVAAQEGRLLFATTNKYNALDSALVRPGRLDVHIEFKLAERPQIEELYRCFYPPTIAHTEETSEKTGSEAEEEAEPLIHIEDERQSTHKSGYQSHSTDLMNLSKLFSSRIPEREFSMAAIQGHLMRYKTDPQAAIDEVEAWVEEERRQRKEREGSI